MKQININVMPGPSVAIPVRGKGIKKDAYYTLYAIDNTLLNLLDWTERESLATDNPQLGLMNATINGLHTFVVNEMKGL